MKRYIYIIIGIIVAAAIAILVLFLIKNNSNGSPTTTSGAGTGAGTLPVTGTQGSNGSTTGTESGGGTLNVSSSTGAGSGTSTSASAQTFGVLSSDPVLDYFVNAQNNITAIQPTGAIITISNGQSTTINSSTISDIISASFSHDGQKIMVSYGDPRDPQAGIFNVATGQWTGLPQGMLSPVWSPASNYQIAYLAVRANGETSLATMNAATPKVTPTVLISLNATDLSLQWPTPSEFILSDKPTAQSVGSIWAFNSTVGTLTPLVYEEPGAEGVWSNDAAIPYGLVFYDNQAGQSSALKLEPFSGNLPTQTIDFQTLPTKCAFAPDTMATSTTPAASSSSYLALYCGIPRSSSGFSSAQLPDAYNTMALFTSDDIYEVNTASGAVQVLWSDSTQNMDLSDVKVFNNVLFFVNRYDNKLYGLTLSN